jgi:hypothetical protein
MFLDDDSSMAQRERSHLLAVHGGHQGAGHGQGRDMVQSPRRSQERREQRHAVAAATHRGENEWRLEPQLGQYLLAGSPGASWRCHVAAVVDLAGDGERQGVGLLDVQDFAGSIDQDAIVEALQHVVDAATLPVAPHGLRPVDDVAQAQDRRNVPSAEPLECWQQLSAGAQGKVVDQDDVRLQAFQRRANDVLANPDQVARSDRQVGWSLARVAGLRDGGNLEVVGVGRQRTQRVQGRGARDQEHRGAGIAAADRADDMKATAHVAEAEGVVRVDGDLRAGVAAARIDVAMWPHRRRSFGL